MRLLARRRRHLLVGIGRGDALDQRAFVRLAGHDRRVAAEVSRRPFADIQPQVGFAMLRIRAVAIEAVAESIGRTSRLKRIFSGGAAKAEAHSVKLIVAKQKWPNRRTFIGWMLSLLASLYLTKRDSRIATYCFQITDRGPLTTSPIFQ